MTTTPDKKDELLASEYAMGVLEGKAKAAAEQRFDRDPAFRALVEDWQNRLTPVLDDIEAVEPPANVWQEISTRTGSSSENENTGLRASLSFWRGLSFVTGGAAAAAIAALLVLPQQGQIKGTDGNQPLVASLNATGKAPAFLARFDPKTGGLFVRIGLKDEKETRVAELWLIPDDGVPRSLGLLEDDVKGLLNVSAKNRSLFARGGTLAVSLEPDGGSPTGAPTGPVIASGKLQFL